MGNSMSKMLATAACLAASHLHHAYLGTPSTINDENQIPMDTYVFSRHLTSGTPAQGLMVDAAQTPSHPTQAVQPENEFMQEFDNIVDLLKQSMDERQKSTQYEVTFEIRSFWEAGGGLKKLPLRIQVTITFDSNANRHIFGSLNIRWNDSERWRKIFTINEVQIENETAQPQIVIGTREPIYVGTENPTSLVLDRSTLLSQCNGILEKPPDLIDDGDAFTQAFDDISGRLRRTPSAEDDVKNVTFEISKLSQTETKPMRITVHIEYNKDGTKESSGSFQMRGNHSEWTEIAKITRVTITDAKIDIRTDKPFGESAGTHKRLTIIRAESVKRFGSMHLIYNDEVVAQ